MSRVFRRGITETSPELADVIYQYPTQHQSKLLQVRGMFLTLCHALPEITGSKPITSSLLVEVRLYCTLVHNITGFVAPPGPAGARGLCGGERGSVHHGPARHQVQRQGGEAVLYTCTQYNRFCRRSARP